VDDIAGAEVRRSRRLVVAFHATVANYEYLVYWRFYQDGNIECEVRATGIMVTTSFAEGEQPSYGALIDERTYAPYHQHFLVARLDLDVDGEGWSSATSLFARRRRASRTTTGRPSVPGRSSTTTPETGWVRRPPTSSFPVVVSLRCSTHLLPC
jgi:hypothetical protein